MSTKLTRRRFLEIAGAVGAMSVTLASTPGCDSAERTNPSKKSQPKRAEQGQAGGSASGSSGYVRAFRSRSDLSPPVIDVVTQAHHTAPGYAFVAPKKGVGQYGPMIVDNSGEPVWFRPTESDKATALDFRMQKYRGEPVLTWWGGKVQHGVRKDDPNGARTPPLGEYLILDGSYREVARLRAGNGYEGDHHEFLISPQDTALITIFNKTDGNLSSVGGSKDGVVVEGMIQELDIETGEVLFEWHSLDHVGLDESYFKLPENPRKAYDYFHINSIDVDRDGNLIVSARVTSAVYKIDRETGEVIWRLGGKKSDFEMGPGTRINYQHDARRLPDGTLTIFDNAVPRESRGIVLELDEDAMTAELVREYKHPDEKVSRTQGNMQVLPNGNVFVGWGSEPAFSEFNSEGELLFDANFPPATEATPADESYRAYRFPWSGQPGDEDPAVAAETGPDDEVTVYASWNGATEVATWQVLSGPGSDRLKPVGSAPKAGFETAITVSTAEPYVGVRARDRSGRVLGTSKAIKPGD